MPLNFLNPRLGTPLAEQRLVDPKDALRAIAAFRLALPRTILRFAGGREITLGGCRRQPVGATAAVVRSRLVGTRPARSRVRSNRRGSVHCVVAG